MPVLYPDVLTQATRLDKSADKKFSGYGIVYATDISGHRMVRSFADLLKIPCPILSPSEGPSVDSNGSDALGQEWYVAADERNNQGKPSKYKLTKWTPTTRDSDKVRYTTADNWTRIADLTAEDQANITALINRVTKIEEYRYCNGVEKYKADGQTALNQGTYIRAKIDEGSANVLAAQEGGISLLTDKTLVSPSITGTWKFFKNDGTTEVSASSLGLNVNNSWVTLENGYKAQWTGTYKWTHSESGKDPESVSGNWTTLADSGVASSIYTSAVVGSYTTISVKLSAPKKGLEVEVVNGRSTNKVKPATGEDTTSASVGVSFSDRIYYGATASEKITEADIKKCSNRLGGKAQTISGVTPGVGNYWIYAYPASLGNLKGIVQDNALAILPSFTQQYTADNPLTITNGAGVQVKLIVYKSNNAAAFSNARVSLS